MQGLVAATAKCILSMVVPASGVSAICVAEGWTTCACECALCKRHMLGQTCFQRYVARRFLCSLNPRSVKPYHASMGRRQS